MTFLLLTNIRQNSCMNSQSFYVVSCIKYLLIVVIFNINLLPSIKKIVIIKMFIYLCK